jgi:hypothetical protein
LKAARALPFTNHFPQFICHQTRQGGKYETRILCGDISKENRLRDQDKDKRRKAGQTQFSGTKILDSFDHDLSLSPQSPP